VKTDVDVLRIEMSSYCQDVNTVEVSVKDIEMAVDNAHLCLEKVEDCVNGFVETTRRISVVSETNSKSLGMEIQRVQWETHGQIKNFYKKFERVNEVINKKMVHLDKELDRVTALVGEKICAGMEELKAEFLEAMEVEGRRYGPRTWSWLSQGWRLLRRLMFSSQVSVIFFPWVMGCTVVYFLMGHGVYSGTFSHGSWTVRWHAVPWVMGCTAVYFLMGHGPYGGMLSHGSWTVWWWIHPWVMGRTVVYFLMGHGPYSDMLSHGSWGIRWYILPWVMDHTVVYSPMGHVVYGDTLPQILKTPLLSLPPIPSPALFQSFSQTLLFPDHGHCCCHPSPLPIYLHWKAHHPGCKPTHLNLSLNPPAHISKGPNHPTHLFCNNSLLLIPPLCSCPCS
jgi:hypothetical protein